MRDRSLEDCRNKLISSRQPGRRRDRKGSLGLGKTIAAGGPGIERDPVRGAGTSLPTYQWSSLTPMPKFGCHSLTFIESIGSLIPTSI